MWYFVPFLPYCVTCVVSPRRFHDDRSDQQRPPFLVGHLSSLAQDPDGDHERVDHLVLLEQPAANVGEHVEAHVVDENLEPLGDVVVLLGPLEALREEVLVELEATSSGTGVRIWEIGGFVGVRVCVCATFRA